MASYHTKSSVYKGVAMVTTVRGHGRIVADKASSELGDVCFEFEILKFSVMASVENDIVCDLRERIFIKISRREMFGH